MGFIQRRSFLITAGALIAAPLVDAQQAAGITRIGFLANSQTALGHLRDAFVQGLGDLGYVEGRNLVIEYRFAEGKLDQFPALAAELVALKVKVIVAPPHQPRRLRSKRPRPSRLSSLASAIRLGAGSSRASRGRAAMSPGFPALTQSLSASAWSSSSTPCRGSVGSPSSGIRAARANACNETC